MLKHFGDQLTSLEEKESIKVKERERDPSTWERLTKSALFEYGARIPSSYNPELMYNRMKERKKERLKRGSINGGFFFLVCFFCIFIRHRKIYNKAGFHKRSTLGLFFPHFISPLLYLAQVSNKLPKDSLRITRVNFQQPCCLNSFTIVSPTFAVR